MNITPVATTPTNAAPRAFQPAAGGFPQLRLDGLLLELHTVDDQPAPHARAQGGGGAD